VDNASFGKQYIHIDDSRLVFFRQIPAHFFFALLDPGEELGGRQVCFQLDNLVEEPTFSRHANRLCFIERGTRQYFNAVLLYSEERSFEIFSPVSNIASQTQKILHSAAFFKPEKYYYSSQEIWYPFFGRDGHYTKPRNAGFKKHPSHLILFGKEAVYPPMEFGLVFFVRICHYKRAMQKVEKWRVQELALMLEHLHDLLRKAGDNEWANVFMHFHHEAVEILSREELKLDSLKRLVQNIATGFESFHSVSNLSLGHEDFEAKSEWNRTFQRAKTRLISILTEIDKRTFEFTH